MNCKKGMNIVEIGIYIHIPFCIKKCYYCDFVSYPNMLKKQEEKQSKEKKEKNDLLKDLCKKSNQIKIY